jgi:hypothetical protein
MTGKYKQDICVWFMSVKPSTILSSLRTSFPPLRCYKGTNNLHYKSQSCHSISMQFAVFLNVMLYKAVRSCGPNPRTSGMCDVQKTQPDSDVFQAPKHTSPFAHISLHVPAVLNHLQRGATPQKTQPSESQL